MRQMAVIITRWTNRIPHDKYIETLSQEYWASEDRMADLIIVYHGTDLEDSHLMKAVYEDAHIRTHKACTDGRTQGQLALEAHKIGIQDYEAYCIMDDDAVMRDPHHTLGKIKKALIDRKEGATGPFGTYRQFSKYDYREPDLEYQEMVWSPWTTTGIQCYRSEHMKEIWTHVESILSKVKSNTDYPIWMLLELFGHRTTEFKDVSFRHKCSNGDIGIKDQHWYLRRLSDAYYNYLVIQDEFRRLRNSPEKDLPNWDRKCYDMLGRAEKILRNRVNRSIRDGYNYRDETWTIPLLRHHSDMLNYIAKHHFRPTLEKPNG